MQLRNGSLLFSASDLNHFVECEHRAWLERERALGRIERPPDADPTALLAAQKGGEHEQAYLEALRRAGREVVPIADERADLEAAAGATRAAMRAGAEVIYQGVLLGDGWLGYADFLRRVPRPSALGAWSYEVADTKLARRAKPYFLLQLCGYSEQVAKLQGVEPLAMHVVLGTGEERSFLYRDYDAYFRRVRDRFLAAARGSDAPSYPLPVEHCALCPWHSRCAQRWQEDDHLCRVADMRRAQIARLQGAGITTLTALGRAAPEARPRGVAPAIFEALRGQARLQLAQAEGGEPRYELLPPEPGRGFALLPEPSSGDVFFDMEGDPFFEGGLEYLLGAVCRDAAGWAYAAHWGHDAAGEQRAFEAVVDFFTARRGRHPDAHVYHYAHYEPVALKRLAGRYGTREDALDELLRAGVFVDLHRVVRQAIRVSRPSYSIKELETFYAGARQAAVKDAGGSIVAYEQWLESRDPAALDDIARYNEEDCRSTLGLRDWLLARRDEARRDFGPPPSPPPDHGREPNPERERIEAEQAALIAGLTAGLPADPAAATPADRARGLLACLIEYHRREERPVWWAFFERLRMTPQELTEDPESIGELTPDPEHPPRPDKRSTMYSFRFPPQEFKLGEGDSVHDPATGQAAGTVVEVDGSALRLRLRRGPKLAGTPLPRAVIPGGPVPAPKQKEAVRRVAAAALADGIEGEGRFRAVRDVVRRALPRVRGLAAGAPLQGTEVDEATAWRAVSGLDRSYLFIQGPPGSGKTWLGARLIVSLIAAGKRVGVTALSHRAIHNLLFEVEKVADERGVGFEGLKKAVADNEESRFVSRLGRAPIANTEENPAGWPAGCALLAGTAWLFSRPELDETADYLFVDEAGQVSLADAVAIGTSAHNLVLLGDPQQLAQVSLGAHPEGAGVSVLEHLLENRGTVTPERGLFLERSWRMHPEVCRFISEIAYEGRLHSAPHRERQRVEAHGLAGAGLRFVPVAHQGRSQSADEEVEAIAAALPGLLGGSFTDAEGGRRPLTLADVLVVTPYNAQVRQLRIGLPDGARVGTVDKFQGQEGAVVFFSMATSGAEEMPRGLEFLFSRNRLNVAFSRARALAVLVASPRLLEVGCHSAEQMRMVNALCRFVEMAEGAGARG